MRLSKPRVRGYLDIKKLRYVLFKVFSKPRW